MEPQNPSNDVADPAEEKRTDLPSSSDEQGQVEQPDHNDQVGNTPVVETATDAAPVYNDPTPQAPQQSDGEAVTDGFGDEEQPGAGEDPETPNYPESDNS